MAIVNEIKCARCDRKYSGVRARCPYCGARRAGYGKHADNSNKDRVKMIVCVMIMAVFTVAAGILLFTTPADADNQNGQNDSSIASPDIDIDSVEGHHQETAPEPTPTPEPTPEPPPEVQSATIRYETSSRTEFSVSVGETVPINVIWSPSEATDPVISWSSSDEEKFQVVPTQLDQVRVNVTGVGVGSATLTVIVDGVEQTCTVHVTR